MKKIQILLLLSLSYVYSHDQNLIVIVDSLQQESSLKEDITATHQLVTALQQKAAPILTSACLWKNIADRKKSFSKQLKNNSSIEFGLYRLYQEVHKELQRVDYDIAHINKKLSLRWYIENHSQLHHASQAHLDQIKFNFFCYNFDFDINQWSVFDLKTGMLLFVPIDNSLQLDTRYQVFHEHDLLRHADKKNNFLESLNFLKNNQDEWIVYLSGHGNPKYEKYKAHIAGLPIEEFSRFLLFLNKAIKVKLLVYSSCFGGGVHTVEPYKNISLHFPVIVVALTDAPIYGFGLFEGVKLPPYNVNFKLTQKDVQVGIGLLPSTTQYFNTFFKKAHKNQYDYSLVTLISQFYHCEQKICLLQKIENIPLIRKAHTTCFLPMDDTMQLNLVKEVNHDVLVTTSKPLLLYRKKIESIKIAQPVDFVSMLPGLQNHEIGYLHAETLLLSQLINQSFLSVDDAQKNKNYLIRKVSCINDILDQKIPTELTHVMIIQHGFIPHFLDNTDHVLIFFETNNQYYCALWDKQQCMKLIDLTYEQSKIIRDLEFFIQQSIDFQSDLTSMQLLEFDAYINNKRHHKTILESCVESKICKNFI